MPVELLATCDRPFDPLHDDEHLGIAREDGVAGALGGATPVRGIAGAPGGGPVRLVLEVEGDDVIVIGVPGREHLPGRHPAVLGEAALAVPEPVHEAVVGQRVVVEDDHESEATGLGDDGVHDLQGRLALQVGIATAAVVDAGGRRAPDRLQREGHADRVEAEVVDLLEHVLVVAGPQAVRCLVGGLQAEPVDPLPDHRVALGIDDAIALRGQRVRHIGRRRRRLRRGLGRHRAVGVQDHVGARVERLGGVAALPDGVDDVPALTGGHVDAHRRCRLERPEAGVVHEVEVAPLQRLGDVEAGLGDVDPEVARRVGRGGLPREGVPAIGIGPQGRGLPLRGRRVECGVLATSGAAELAVGNEGLVVAVGRRLVDLGPVVERLRVGLPGGCAHRRTAVAEEALPDTGGGQGQGAVG